MIGTDFETLSDMDAADIVVIGDSYIESPMTRPSALITTRLAQLQGKTVANLGHSGYGPQQELAVLKRFGLPLNPRTVIWAFFEGNDLSDIEEYPGKAARVAGQHAAWQDFWFRSLSRNLLSLYFRGTSDCVPNSRLQQYGADFSDANNSVQTDIVCSVRNSRTFGRNLTESSIIFLGSLPAVPGSQYTFRSRFRPREIPGLP